MKHCAARFLLKPGRKYEEAVKTFQPYDKVKEPNPEAREAGRALVSVGRDAAGCELFVYVNNRLEGNALETIDAMLERATAQESAVTISYQRDGWWCAMNAEPSY